MDKKSIAIVTLALSNVPYDEYGSHMATVMKTGKEFHEFNIYFMTPGRMAIDVARNACTQAAKDAGCQAIFFFDDDTFLNPTVIKHLYDKMFPEDGPELDAIMPLYFIRGDGFPVMAFRLTEDGKNLRSLYDSEWENKTDLIKADCLGNGCTLYNMKVFDKIPHPWFLTKPGQYTEDVYFFSKARHYMGTIEAYMDPTISCGHFARPIRIDGDNYKYVRAVEFINECDDEKKQTIIDSIMKATQEEATKVELRREKNFKQSLEWYEGEKDGECVQKAAGRSD